MDKDYKAMILSLVASATLCDHMGDMWNDLNFVLKEMGEDDLLEEFDELPKKLHLRGIKTVYGSEVWSKEDEDAEGLDGNGEDILSQDDIATDGVAW